MDLHLPPLSRQDASTGQPFSDGDRVTSALWRDLATGEVRRSDWVEGGLLDYAPEGEVFCRWSHVFKEKGGPEQPGHQLKLTAEALFLGLCENGNDRSPENAPLKQFLALMLERKRVLKPRGRSSECERFIYEHTRRKQTFEIPATEYDTAFFVRIQESLSALIPAKKPAEKPRQAADAAGQPVEGAEPANSVESSEPPEAQP
jgi:hypothetical protein